MDPNQIIADAVQSHGGLCVLDKIHLPYAHADSGPAAKFGLGCQLFLSDRDAAAVREGSRRFLVDYYQLFPDKVNEFLPSSSRRTVKFKGDPGERIRADSGKYPLNRSYSASLFGAVDIGLPNDDVDPYQAYALVVEAQSDELSAVTAAMPACSNAEQPNVELLLSAVLRWCEIVRPVHGCAGFTLVFATGMSQNTAYALQLLKRFPGFDTGSSVDFSIRAKATHNRIKSINWLTVLCDDIVGELGGIERLRGELGPACTLHRYAGGIVIQAGDRPQLGDTQRGDIPEVYRLVARVTRPVRFEQYKHALFEVPDGMDDLAETLAWVRRFD
jgi:Protein of unknown function (DUF3396)